jgi:hypothetical protein
MGIDYYDYKKGAGSEASLGDFLGDRIEQSLGIGNEDSDVNKTIGTQREERIASRKAEKEASGQGMFGGYVENLKGFLTRPLTNPATNETLGRFMPTGGNVNPAYGTFYQSSTDQQRNILRQQQINNILNASNTEPVASNTGPNAWIGDSSVKLTQNQIDEAMANAAIRLGRN